MSVLSNSDYKALDKIGLHLPLNGIGKNYIFIEKITGKRSRSNI